MPRNERAEHHAGEHAKNQQNEQGWDCRDGPFDRHGSEGHVDIDGAHANGGITLAKSAAAAAECRAVGHTVLAQCAVYERHWGPFFLI
jgi:hypothetical protein